MSWKQKKGTLSSAPVICCQYQANYLGEVASLEACQHSLRLIRRDETFAPSDEILVNLQHLFLLLGVTEPSLDTILELFQRSQVSLHAIESRCQNLRTNLRTVLINSTLRHDNRDVICLESIPGFLIKHRLGSRRQSCDGFETVTFRRNPILANILHSQSFDQFPIVADTGSIQRINHHLQNLRITTLQQPDNIIQRKKRQSCFDRFCGRNFFASGFIFGLAEIELALDF